jgi:3-mercaptopyruvate sulfurtransferase SseA
MSYTTLISAEQLQALVASAKPLRIFDCTFDLMKPGAGQEQYLASHIPGAVYANLDTALSAKHGVPGAHGVITASGADAPASGGRHPLPNREKFATWLSSVGFANDMQAVVYDRNGANYCGRLWWMLKWAGHENVAVLDGGLQAWQAAGGAVNSGEEPAHFQANFLLGPEKATLVSAANRGRAARPPGADPGRCARHAALQGRSRAAGPGGGPHPRRAEPALQPEHRRPTASSSRRSNSRPSLKPCWPAATRPAWCTTAAAASAPCPT